MLSGMSCRTFLEWQQYYSIEPFGEFRAELRHGQQMALAANINRNSEKRPDPFDAIDFMNYVDKPEVVEREMTTEELEAYATSVFGA